jgi:hypothetical protein
MKMRLFLLLLGIEHIVGMRYLETLTQGTLYMVLGHGG